MYRRGFGVRIGFCKLGSDLYEMFIKFFFIIGYLVDKFSYVYNE